MPTPWTYPTIVTQHAEVDQHISWDESKFHCIKNADGQYLPTTKELIHIANPTVNDIKNKTNYLFLKGFNFVNLPTTISGIEAEICINRGGRISDETVQLMYNGTFISDNTADYSLDITKIYGSPTSIWGESNITNIMLADPEFGIGVRYQSHPSWPHRESPKLDYIRLRVW